MCDLHAAALVLAHATDICDVFVTCKTLPRSPDGCSKPSAGVPEDADALINKVQAAYGAFRKLSCLLHLQEVMVPLLITKNS